MVLLSTVRASNASLSTTFPSLTAVFVGGTSGIGAATLKQLARYAAKPHIIIVGRNEEGAKAAIASAKESALRQAHDESGATYEFVQADVSLLEGVDAACERIKATVDHVDLLFLSPGYVTFGGRKETKEGLDELFALRYHSRWRFVHNLLPLLSSSPLARVVSILGAGDEAALLPDDLELAKPGNYTFLRSAGTSATLNTLAAEHLARQHPAVSFIHGFPGIGQTNLFSNADAFSAPVRAVFKLASPLLWLASTPLEEIGERQLFHATSARYAPRAGSKGVALGEGVTVAAGIDGVEGSGGYALGRDGETIKTSKLLETYRQEGWPAKAWEHTVSVFNRITGN